jgi:hypothetical protein
MHEALLENFNNVQKHYQQNLKPGAAILKYLLQEKNFSSSSALQAYRLQHRRLHRVQEGPPFNFMCPGRRRTTVRAGLDGTARIYVSRRYKLGDPFATGGLPAGTAGTGMYNPSSTILILGLTSHGVRIRKPF